MRCSLCQGKGKVWRNGRMWYCECQIPMTDYNKRVVADAYKECSRKYANGETGFDNIMFSIRRASHYYTVEQLSKMGPLTRKEIRDILRGQERLRAE